jgi:opacity protein-like surface antigen
VKSLTFRDVWPCPIHVTGKTQSQGGHDLMRRLLFLLSATSLFYVVQCVPALAQSGTNSGPDRVEIFGGYSYLGSDFNFPEFSSDHFNGWEASVTGKVNRWAGITADISGHYGSSIAVGVAPDFMSEETPHQYTVMFGPQLSYPNRTRVIPFAHALFGFSNAKVGQFDLDAVNTASDTGFAMALGGGLDFSLTKNIAIRGVQADWMRTTLFHQTQNEPRLSTGIVFRF